MEIAACTGMDKAFKAEMIYAACLKLIEEAYPGINKESAVNLGRLKAESLIYSIITHKEFDEILMSLKREGRESKKGGENNEE